MCLPSASIEQSVVGAEPGTRKGEVTATLAISAASKFVLPANFCRSHWDCFWAVGQSWSDSTVAADISLYTRDGRRLYAP